MLHRSVKKNIFKKIDQTRWLYDQFQYFRASGRIEDDQLLSEKITIKENDRSLFVLDGYFNYSFDIQSLLLSIKERLNRSSRHGIVMYSQYIKFVYKIMKSLGMRTDPIPQTLITENDLQNLAKISGFELVSTSRIFYLPLPLFINNLISMIPLIKRLSLVNYYVLRPLLIETKRPSLSIVIPARNEKGNIENAILRLPDFAAQVEIIFVEGNSTDSTWQEILRIQEKYKNQYNIQCYQQTGKGKNDAVRLGFSKANGELLTILDADLTMPPEKLPLFYESYLKGHGDFINGSRLVYPMEGEAMKSLNLMGNVFFAKFLSWILSVKIGDSLCGTKLVSKKDYERFIKWRKFFGDFDPFGDFELIFPAAILSLGIVDIPVYYRARTYGETNIRRFYHGFILLKMCTIGIFNIKLRIKNDKLAKN
jgi:hypothetical protein